MKSTLKLNLFLVTVLAITGPVFGAEPAQVVPSVKADNTAINARDRSENSLTPLDQGRLMPDIDTTAGIRRDIIGHKGMSVDAQNVKIITQYGKVTLRGPVKTAEEKKFIGKSARSRINPENVDNQLQVVGDSERK